MIILRSVKGSDLLPSEVDGNFIDLDGRVTDIENNPPEAVGIASAQVTGNQLVFVLTDSSVTDPVTLPVAKFNPRGEWQPATAYTAMDVVTNNHDLYLVMSTHTSEATFNPGANDGLGHDYYALLLDVPVWNFRGVWEVDEVYFENDVVTVANSIYLVTSEVEAEAPFDPSIVGPNGLVYVLMVTAPQGETGPEGTQFRVGYGPPDDYMGRNGDFYLNEGDGSLYQKQDDEYVYITQLTQGPPGPQGDTGPQGLQGDPGTPGAPGSVFRVGYGEPDPGLGIDGDVYLDESDGALWLKQGGVYVFVMYLMAGAPGAPGAPGANGSDGADGADGAPGSQIYADYGAPDDGNGLDNDLYLDESTGDVWHKQSGTWVLILSLTPTVTFASDADVWAATPDRTMTTDLLESASAFQALSDAATVAVDWEAGINFTLTITDDRVIGNPTNGQPGTFRNILVQGNDSTDRTITFDSNYEGELPTIEDCDNTHWYMLTIMCLTATHFIVSAKQAL